MAVQVAFERQQAEGVGNLLEADVRQPDCGRKIRLAQELVGGEVLEGDLTAKNLQGDRFFEADRVRLDQQVGVGRRQLETAYSKAVESESATEARTAEVDLGSRPSSEVEG